MAQSKFSIIFFLLLLFAGSLSANQIPILKPEIRAPILKNSLLPLINWNTINLEFGDDAFQAALFERSGWYWFFFNQKNIIDIHDVLARKNESYYEYEKNLIFRVKSNFFPNLIKEGKRLQVEFGGSIPESIRTLEPIVNRASVEIAVFNNIQDYTQLIDPDIDDQIFIVPGNLQEVTLEKDYNFTYLTQGMEW